MNHHNFNSPDFDLTEILESLNEAQKEAVSAPIGKLRVLAGAGSGKTKVLVHRIAWLMSFNPGAVNNILAVTFTNKAAAEMKSRVEALLGFSTKSFWIGTFHHICHRILRIHAENIGLSKDFPILDRDDQLRLIKRLIKEYGFDENVLKPKTALNSISAYKEAGVRASDIDNIGAYPKEKVIRDFYALYENHCRKNSLVDFTELLLRTVELLRDNEAIRRHYQNRFSHILVDEFQDTNIIQYAFIKLISKDDCDLFVVGDDDQSIYAFRGAKVENFLDMSEDFPDLKTVKLEKNYRSTGNILSAANKIIDKNDNRLGKSLWTDQGSGDLIDVYEAFSDRDEASYVATRVKQYVEQGGRFNDAGVLYRSNVQSRVLEEALIKYNVPYRIYGGLRFFDRAEIRDALAYLRLSFSFENDVAFERAINMPNRGIGPKTLDKIREVARENSTSLFLALLYLLEKGLLTGKAKSGAFDFSEMIKKYSTTIKSNDMPLEELMKDILESSGILSHYKIKQESDNHQNSAIDRVENLQELLLACRQFSDSLSVDEKEDSVGLFLTQASLDAGESQADEFSDSLQLMTLHAAKGLEFKHVFLVGLEEGLFPHKEAEDNKQQLEEERRLAYVGITRAREKLHLTYAESRQLYGVSSYSSRPSRFIGELPENTLRYIRPKKKIKNILPTKGFSYSKGQNITKNNNSIWNLGQSVLHPTFGEGVITKIEGEGEHLRLYIQFKEYGSKCLVAAFARLTKL